jgi:hypothetical protein
MVMALFRGMCRPDPQYSAASVREEKCTCLGYETRLSRLHTLDPLLALGVLRSSHSATSDQEQKKTKRPQISRMYLKQTHLRQDYTTISRGEIGKK